ncbi:hypothetical protein R5R35_000804 [Gryllus longicercus]|uniref:Chromatin accessibility complex protein 1 n=1 Tax=Gryllus longicercus TaxID=2509291 RepID=A0AAN9ZBW3_9ORTH
MAGRKGKREKKLVKLPESRIKTIMKSSPEVENIGKEALFLVNKATEFFIHYLAKSAHAISSNKQELCYSDVAEIVQTNEIMSFIKEIMPRTITFSQYKELMVAKGLPIEYESSESESDVKGRKSNEEDFDYFEPEQSYEDSENVFEMEDEIKESK